MAEKLYIGGELESKAVDGVVAAASAIKDKVKDKFQGEINAEVDASLEDRYTKEETYSKTQLDSMITTPDTPYIDVDTYAELEALTEHPAGAIYRVANYDGTQVVTNKYSEYSWDGTQYKLMAVRDHGIDNEPTAGSNNLVKSGGVQNELALGAVYDVSAKNPTAGPNNDGKFTLEYILDQNNVNTLIPTAVRKGGMSIKFVHSSDNKYVQARLMANTFTTDVTAWQVVDKEPTTGSKNLVESGGIAESIAKINSLISDINLGSLELTNIEDGYYYDTYAVKQQSVSHAIANFNVVDNVDYLYVEARIGNNATIQFFNENNVSIGQYVGVQSDTGIVSTKAYILVPNDCAKISVSYVKSRGLKYGIKNIEDRLSSNEYVIAETKDTLGKLLSFNSTVDGKFLNSAGNLETLAAAAIDKYNLFNLVSIHIKARVGDAMYIIFYDKEYHILSKYPGNKDSGINVDSDFSVPENANYVCISYVKARGCEVTAIESGVLLDVRNLKNKTKLLDRTVGGGVILEETETGVYLDSSASEVQSGSFNIDKYSLLNISQLHVKARMGEGSYGWFFDDNDDKISGFNGNNESGINVDSDIDVPSNAIYLRVSYVNTYTCEVTPEPTGLTSLYDKVYAIEKELKSWQGKKIGLLGDSIAEGSASTAAQYRFINIAASILGATVKNAAIGGWYLGDYEDKSIYKQVNGVSPATRSLDGDEDVVVIFAGTNDFGHAFPIGEPYTIDANGHKTPSTDETTTCGGLVKTIQTLYAKYNGYVPILICTPIQRRASGTYSSGGSWDKNNINKYMDDYIDAIIQTATYYGIPVADFYHNNMNPNVAAADTLYFSDGLHPNNAGHRLIGMQLAKELKEKIQL